MLKYRRVGQSVAPILLEGQILAIHYWTIVLRGVIDSSISVVQKKKKGDSGSLFE